MNKSRWQRPYSLHLSKEHFVPPPLEIRLPFLRRFPILCGLTLLLLLFTACAPAATAIVETDVIGEVPVEVTQPVEVQVTPVHTATAFLSPEPTQRLTATGVASIETPIADPTKPSPVELEPRLVEYDWPPRMRLGDSDLISLSLIPYEEGYIATTEYEDHRSETAEVEVEHLPGYDLWAIARLDAVGFEHSPSAELIQPAPQGEKITWHWNITPHSAGRHRPLLTLALRWTPQVNTTGLTESETVIWSQGLTIYVDSLLGLSTQEARTIGFAGLGLDFAFGILWLLLTQRERLRRHHSERAARLPGYIPPAADPNPNLALDVPHGLQLNSDEVALLQSAFFNYSRLTLETEYASGYSGTRTFLALPTRLDGLNDARTIVKLGPRETLVREYHNYETYIKRTLPPITARIQEPPVLLSGPNAALRYTFVGAPNRVPHSLREVALTRPATTVAVLLETLFDTFGPNWWLQNRPHTAPAAAEFDSLLPSHLILEPAQSPGRRFHLQSDRLADLTPGDVLSLHGITDRERRADGQSWTLRAPGSLCPIRVRYLGPRPGPNPIGRVVATRRSFLTHTLTELLPGYDPEAATLPTPLPALPNPMLHYERLLKEPFTSLRSIIHGDLNLENVLVGPGDLVWLIDFAETREGYAILDFARLETELIAHVCAPKLRAANLAAADFLPVLASLQIQASKPQQPILAELTTLLAAVHRLAAHLQSDPTQPHEHNISLFFTTMGALKFANLDPFSKQLLFLTAAHSVQLL